MLCGSGYAKDMNAVPSFGEVSEVKGYGPYFSIYWLVASQMHLVYFLLKYFSTSTRLKKSF